MTLKFMNSITKQKFKKGIDIQSLFCYNKDRKRGKTNDNFINNNDSCRYNNDVLVVCNIKYISRNQYTLYYTNNNKYLLYNIINNNNDTCIKKGDKK